MKPNRLPPIKAASLSQALSQQRGGVKESLDPELIAVLTELSHTVQPPEIAAAEAERRAYEQRPSVDYFLALVKDKDSNGKQITRLSKELETLKEQLSVTSAENQKVDLRIRELEDYLKKHEVDMSQLKGMRERVEKLAQKVAMDRKERDGVMQWRLDLEDKTDTINADVSVAMAVVKALSAKKVMMERAHASLLRDKEEFEQILAESRQDLEDRTADARRINTELKVALERGMGVTQSLEKKNVELQENLVRTKQQAIELMHQVAIKDAQAAKDARDARKRKELEALEGKYPSGLVTLVFTDIQGSTQQWDKQPEIMVKAIKVHDDISRLLIQKWNAYEIKNEGDSFMVAFRTAHSAVRFCIDLQQKLLEADWPAELLTNGFSNEERGEDGNLLWRGLRVRCGIHTCTPQTQLDKNGCIEYVGVPVLHAAKIASMSCGGQIVLSGATVAATQEDTMDGAELLVIEELQLSNARCEQLLQIMPHNLAARKFNNAERLATDKAKKNSLAQKYMKLQTTAMENKLDRIVDALEKTMEGKAETVTSGELVSEEAAKSRLRIVTAQLGDIHEKSAELNKRKMLLKDKYARSKTKTDNLQTELRQKRAERDMYKKIADEYSQDKRSKDMALIKANAVTFCLLLKQSILEQQTEAAKLERDHYERQTSTFKGEMGKFGASDVKDLEKLSSDQLAMLETSSRRETNDYLEETLRGLQAEAETTERLIQDLTRHLSQTAAEEANREQIIKPPPPPPPSITTTLVENAPPLRTASVTISAATPANPLTAPPATALLPVEFIAASIPQPPKEEQQPQQTKEESIVITTVTAAAPPSSTTTITETRPPATLIDQPQPTEDKPPSPPPEEEQLILPLQQPTVAQTTSAAQTLLSSIKSPSSSTGSLSGMTQAETIKVLGTMGMKDSAQQLMEAQADVQEELAAVNSSLHDLEAQLKALEENLVSIADSSSGSAEGLRKKKALLQYRVTKTAKERERLERQNAYFMEVRAEEQRLAELIIKRQEKQAALLAKQAFSLQKTLSRLTSENIE